MIIIDEDGFTKDTSLQRATGRFSYTWREKTLRNKTAQDIKAAALAVLDGRPMTDKQYRRLDQLPQDKKYTLVELNNLVDEIVYSNFHH